MKRWPAEWEPHAATWLAWPHNEASWPGRLETVPPVYGRLIEILTQHEQVCLLVNDSDMEAAVRKSLVSFDINHDQLQIYHIPTNDAWMRDTGPLWVQEGSDLKATDWQFNKWGGKYPPWDLDNEIPLRMVEQLHYPIESLPYVLEGGSVDSNGAGDLLTTEQCLLNPNRNPTLDRSGVEALLRDMLHVERIHWLGEGIVGDDTDGHVDDIARFVAVDTIVAVREDTPDDENYALLEDNWERLQQLQDGAGQSFKIHALPMPKPVMIDDERVPASYANFYIANRVVIVPTFQQADRDSEAVGVLQNLFPERQVIGLDASDLIWGLGAFHCITHHQPK